MENVFAAVIAIAVSLILACAATLAVFGTYTIITGGR